MKTPSLQQQGKQTAPDASSAFEEFVASSDRRLYNLVLRMVCDRDDAADITQEAFVRAYRAWDSFEGRSSRYTWICQIAINLCRNRARDLTRWDEEPPDDDLAAPHEQGPQAQLDKGELQAVVRKAMDALPESYRLIAVLRDLQGLTYKEISEVTGVGVDVVKTRLARARGMLRRKLEPYLSKE